MSVLRYCSTTVLTAATMIVQSKVLTSLEDKMWGGCDRPSCPPMAPALVRTCKSARILTGCMILGLHSLLLRIVDD